MTDRRRVEVRLFKWPQRPRGVSMVRFLGEDGYGRWLGSAKGDPWAMADGSRSGLYTHSFVSVTPHGTFWSACFHPVDPVVDVDIILPVHWEGDVLEEVDLELDVLRLADGTVQVRDRDEFERMKATWHLPDEIAAQAEATCERIRKMVEQCAEPFGEVGKGWLARFLAEVEPPDLQRPVEEDNDRALLAVGIILVGPESTGG